MTQPAVHLWVGVNMSRNVRKRTFGHMRPVKFQIKLRGGSSLGAFCLTQDAKFLHVDKKALIRMRGGVVVAPSIAHM